MRPPKPSALADAAARQQHKANNTASSPNMAVQFAGSMDEGSEDDSDDPSLPVSRPRAPRHSKGPTPPSATTIGFYGPSWKVPLINAQYEWQLYVATENPFPARNKHLRRAAYILATCIEAHRNAGNVLDDCRLPDLCIIQNISNNLLM